MDSVVWKNWALTKCKILFLLIIQNLCVLVTALRIAVGLMVALTPLPVPKQDDKPPTLKVLLLHPHMDNDKGLARDC
jgi:hypothetical protein